MGLILTHFSRVSQDLATPRPPCDVTFSVIMLDRMLIGRCNPMAQCPVHACRCGAKPTSTSFAQPVPYPGPPATSTAAVPALIPPAARGTNVTGAVAPSRTAERATAAPPRSQPPPQGPPCCLECGSPFVPTDRFCGECGATRPAAAVLASAVTVPAPTPPPPTPRLAASVLQPVTPEYDIVEIVARSDTDRGRSDGSSDLARAEASSSTLPPGRPCPTCDRHVPTPARFCEACGSATPPM